MTGVPTLKGTTVSPVEGPVPPPGTFTVVRVADRYILYREAPQAS